ncbi:VWA domain-containing protein [Vibrio sp. JC009]|uniref:Calx-beta domain-containing protein n=1 Tax=Vibrio sp. JC009 TaxID=2912314 RepID=UPI0023AFC3E4|nr:Calx-beta domain-containing protein [Vibrio sp. JC009]WED23142.1 VWA domain-containing protein [Vibrio sp. JC009]
MSALQNSSAGTNKFIAINADGKMIFVDNPNDLQPGEIIISSGERPVSVDLNDITGVQQGDESLSQISDDDLAALFAQLEGGVDPTALEGEEFAPAAGGEQGSALTDSATVQRTGASSLASTAFDTSGIGASELSRTQDVDFNREEATAFVTSVSQAVDVNGDVVNEGDTAVFTVTLSNPLDVAAQYAWSLDEGTAELGPDYDYTDELTFSNGVTLVSSPDFSPLGEGSIGGVLNVPAGVTSFTVSVPTLTDEIYEQSENFTLTVGGETGTATILDENGPPIIIRVEPDLQTEGGYVPEGEKLDFTIELSHPSTTDMVYDWSLNDIEAVLGDDYENSIVFDSGVTFTYDSESGGQLTVPAGVTEFRATVTTIDDTIDEPLIERFELEVGGVAGTGNIIDDDEPTVVTVEPVVGGDTVVEGQEAVFAVTLSNQTYEGHYFSWMLGDGDDSADKGDDYQNSINVNLPGNHPDMFVSGNYIYVPPGVTSFNVGVMTEDDSEDEPVESFTLKVDDASGVANILDNDDPTVIRVDPTPDLEGNRVPEGDPAIFEITLSNETFDEVRFSWELGNFGDFPESDGAEPGVDYDTLAANITFSNGVTLENGELVVPAGVESFTASIPTFHDWEWEVEENFTLTVGGVEGEAVIVDHDCHNDILIGDGGGEANNYNLALIVDVSGSMSSNLGGMSRLAHVNAELTQMLTSLSNYNGIINVTLIAFASTVTAQIEGTPAEILAQLDTVLQIPSSGRATNYEAAFEAANDWYNPPSGETTSAVDGYINTALFLTDGQPTVHNDNTSGSGGTTNVADVTEALNEFNTLTDFGVDVHAISIRNSQTNVIDFFDNTERGDDAITVTVEGGGQVEAVPGEAVDVQSVDDLSEAISNFSLFPVDGDTLDGDLGYDIIFGDVIYAENLNWPGDSFEAHRYEDGITQIKEFIKLDTGTTGEPTEQEVYDFVRANHELLHSPTDPNETQIGEGDLLTGSEQGDIIYGQGGDDELNGEEGDDLLIGGQGSDVMSGGEGADVFKWYSSDLDGSTDVIKDFSIADGDKIDISDLLDANPGTDLDDYVHSGALSEFVDSGTGMTNSQLVLSEPGGSSVTIIFEDTTLADLEVYLQTNGVITD